METLEPRTPINETVFNEMDGNLEKGGRRSHVIITLATIFNIATASVLFLFASFDITKS